MANGGEDVFDGRVEGIVEVGSQSVLRKACKLGEKLVCFFWSATSNSISERNLIAAQV
jgi:hypothetical protein